MIVIYVTTFKYISDCYTKLGSPQLVIIVRKELNWVGNVTVTDYFEQGWSEEARRQRLVCFQRMAFDSYSTGIWVRSRVMPPATSQV